MIGMARQIIQCPDCGNKDNWKIEVEDKGKKKIINITCSCGYGKQFSGYGESVASKD
jgi:predicted nucleic-acid-binding Zn-ribbon protein